MPTLTDTQYEQLLGYAQNSDANKASVLTLRDQIDKANGIKRYYLRIRWIEHGATPPTSFTDWPTTQEYELEKKTTPVAEADVTDVLANNAVKPVTVMVTRDRDGVVGWTALEDYDFSLSQGA